MEYADLIGKPFAWGGRGPERFDCWGLVHYILQRNGRQCPDYPSNIQATKNAATLLTAMGNRRWQIQFKPEPGDVVAFRMDQKYPTHVGLVVGPDLFVHALENTSVVAERLSSPLWNRRHAGFFRWLEGDQECNWKKL